MYSTRLFTCTIIIAYIKDGSKKNHDWANNERLQVKRLDRFTEQ